MSDKGVAAVERALAILDCFESDHESLPLKTIAQKTGLYKSTILRLCVSLESYGYLRRREDGDFQLGPTLWRLGALYRNRFDLPLNLGAAGHLILAYSDGSDPKTEEIKSCGYAISLGERDPNTVSIAVPVLGRGDAFMGALVVSGLGTRFDEAARYQAIDLAKDEARRLSQEIYG